MAHIKICMETDCNDEATTDGYCRLHYLKNWKRVKLEKDERASKRLNAYIRSVMRRNPDGYMEEIKQDIELNKFDPEASIDDLADEEKSLFDDPAFEDELDEVIKELDLVKGY